MIRPQATEGEAARRFRPTVRGSYVVITFDSLQHCREILSRSPRPSDFRQSADRGSFPPAQRRADGLLVSMQFKLVVTLMNRENMRKAPPGTSVIVPSLSAKAEKLLRSLNGIADARVELDRNGRLGAVHIVPSPGVQSKALLRNVQSGLMAALGVGVDARFVYVVQKLPPVKEPQQVAAPAVKAQPEPQPTAPAAAQASHAAQQQRR